MEKDASAPHVRNIRVHIFLCISLLKNIQLFTHSTTQEGKVVRMAGVHLDELEKAQRSMRVSIFNSTLRVMTRQKVIIHQGMFRVQVSCINIFLSFQNTYYIPLFYISFVIFHSLEWNLVHTNPHHTATRDDRLSVYSGVRVREQWYDDWHWGWGYLRGSRRPGFLWVASFIKFTAIFLYS